ncbi:hypothetical protein [Thermomonas aquatica]|uniref:Uncharacterized protein n=1 Tax=Thermomonas aquatica TaxID=2202149 RepID=A0A5B7ZTU1_9GAMM|nr:hypothetical protein [Thermomonas aquatica]QDA57212.1 hypothetical protein FHQ07_07740 [Thermomonas aquatica]
MSHFRYGLSADEVAWVEDVLSNDEVGSDVELLEYFVRGGLTREQADGVLCHRSDYLLNIYPGGQGPLRGAGI